MVAYAAKRHIAVIPEIEMPGHATAALAAYPELACGHGPKSFETSGRWGVLDDVFCPGKEQTFEFLEGVLDEVLELFRRSSSTSAATSVPAYVGRSAPTAGPAWRTKGSRTKPDCKPT